MNKFMHLKNPSLAKIIRLLSNQNQMILMTFLKQFTISFFRDLFIILYDLRDMLVFLLIVTLRQSLCLEVFLLICLDHFFLLLSLYLLLQSFYGLNIHQSIRPIGYQHLSSQFSSVSLQRSWFVLHFKVQRAKIVLFSTCVFQVLSRVELLNFLFLTNHRPYSWIKVLVNRVLHLNFYFILHQQLQGHNYHHLKLTMVFFIQILVGESQGLKTQQDRQFGIDNSILYFDDHSFLFIIKINLQVIESLSKTHTAYHYQTILFLINQNRKKIRYYCLQSLCFRAFRWVNLFDQNYKTILVRIASIIIKYQHMVVIKLLQKFNKNESILKDLQDKLEDQKYQLILGQYKVEKYISSGSFGAVYKGTHLVSTKPVAIKLINIEKLMKDNKSENIREKLKKYLQTQEILMKKCHSAFVVKLYDSYENTKCKILIMEYCRHGGLDSYIEQRGGLQEQDAIQILRQIILGLAELHRNNIIHRDLKPANILIHNGIFKIADFGFGVEIQDSSVQSPRTVCGSRITMAPEVRQTGIYGLKADIWSIGMIYFMMLYAKIPLKQRHFAALRFIQDGKPFVFKTDNGAQIGENSAKFLKQTLQVNSQLRIDWEQTLQHQIFKTKFQRLPTVYLPRIKQVFQNLKKEQVNVLQQQALDLRKSLISFQQLKLQSEKVLQQSIKMREQQLNWQLDIDILNNQYLQCRISQFIYYEMIIPIQSKHLLSMQNRFHVQFLFLLVNRCRENIISAKDMVQSKYPQQLAEHFCQKVNQLQDVINLKFKQISDKLKAIQDKALQIIFDKMSNIFKKSSYQEKEKFLNHFERQSFNKQEQIRFTNEKYLVRIVNEIKGNKGDEERMKKLVKSYRQINEIKLQELQNKRIQKRIDQILEDYD